MTRTIASRKTWGASHSNGVGIRPVGNLQKYLHHSVTAQLPVNATVAQERTQMRLLEHIGQQRFGRGISYTFPIFPSGRIYQGADVDRIAYHSGPGRNTRGVGIVLVGNTHDNPVTPQQRASLVWLLQEGVRRGWWNDPAITEGHRDFSATACPGNYAYKLIQDINREARGGSYEDFKKNGLPGSKPAKQPAQTAPKQPAVKPPAAKGYTGPSIVTYLNSVGMDSSFAARRKLAAKHGIHSYSGSAKQNTLLLSILRGQQSSAPRKSIATMADEVIKGRHGNGHAARRASLGVTAAVYQQVRDEVNRRLK